MQIGHYPSPIGLLELRGSDKGIYSLKFVEKEHPQADIAECLQDAIDRLHAYFNGEADPFTGLQLAIHAADFKRQTLEEIMKIPYGQTLTYGEIARQIDHPQAARAVGTAISNNPLAIILPCHRILPATGKTGEYAWGSWRKEWLLQHEKS